MFDASKVLGTMLMPSQELIESNRLRCIQVLNRQRYLREQLSRYEKIMSAFNTDREPNQKGVMEVMKNNRNYRTEYAENERYLLEDM